MKTLTVEEEEYYLIEELAKGVPIEHIQYILEKEYGLTRELKSLKIVEKNLADKIRIQKEINERRKEKDVDELIIRMKDALIELDELIKRVREQNNKWSNSEIIKAVQQINALINTLLKASGKLQEQQNVKIRVDYIKITQINEFLEQNMVKIAKNLSKEAKNKLKEQLVMIE